LHNYKIVKEREEDPLSVSERFRGKFAKEVKAINENIKVVLTSGHNFSATDISNNGYDEFLQLPVKLSTFVSTAKEMLNS
jgi:hypothetical protein